MIGMRAVDIVQPDVMYMGGMSRTLQVAAMAAAVRTARYAPVHKPIWSLVTICTMHLWVAIPNAASISNSRSKARTITRGRKDCFSRPLRHRRRLREHSGGALAGEFEIILLDTGAI